MLYITLEYNEGLGLRGSCFYADVQNEIHDVVHSWLVGRSFLRVSDWDIRQRRYACIIRMDYCNAHFFRTLLGGSCFHRIPGNGDQWTSPGWFLALGSIKDDVEQHPHCQSYDPWTLNAICLLTAIFLTYIIGSHFFLDNLQNMSIASTFLDLSIAIFLTFVVLLCSYGPWALCLRDDRNEIYNGCSGSV